MNDAQKQNCIKHYESCVERYIETYDRSYPGYPGNQKRLEIIQSIVQKHHPRRLLYIGCGPCIPVVYLMRESGCDIRAIDFSVKMIERARRTLQEEGFNPDIATLGDIEDPDTLPDGEFDLAVIPGVFTHLEEDARALRNLNHKLRPGGVLVAEFRNELFSCFSFNRFSYDFYANSLFENLTVPDAAQEAYDHFLKKRFQIDMDEDIPHRSTHTHKGYWNKFHNPLNIRSLLERYGFSWEENYFYHYHAFPPGLEKQSPELFKQLSLKLESPSDWRGHLMASAFLSEAVKAGNVPD